MTELEQTLHAALERTLQYLMLAKFDAEQAGSDDLAKIAKRDLAAVMDAVAQARSGHGEHTNRLGSKGLRLRIRADHGALFHGGYALPPAHHYLPPALAGKGAGPFPPRPIGVSVPCRVRRGCPVGSRTEARLNPFDRKTDA